MRIVLAARDLHLQGALVIVLFGDAWEPFFRRRPGRAFHRDLAAGGARADDAHAFFAYRGPGVARQIVLAVLDVPAGRGPLAVRGLKGDEALLERLALEIHVAVDADAAVATSHHEQHRATRQPEQDVPADPIPTQCGHHDHLRPRKE